MRHQLLEAFHLCRLWVCAHPFTATRKKHKIYYFLYGTSSKHRQQSTSVGKQSNANALIYLLLHEITRFFHRFDSCSVRCAHCVAIVLFRFLATLSISLHLRVLHCLVLTLCADSNAINATGCRRGPAAAHTDCRRPPPQRQLKNNIKYKIEYQIKR